MAHQVNSIDYGDYRYRVGDTIKIASGKEYLYPAVTGNSYTNTPNISQDVRKITQIWASDANLSVSNPIVTAYHSGPQRYGGGSIRPEQIAVGSGGLKIKHYVRFNANGGSGGPGTQTKVYGSILTISTTKPTRTGYTFSTWNTNSSGSGTNYSPGQQYGVDADLTLYAVWKANTYTVSYNANGGSGAPGAQTKTYGVTLKLSGTKPTRTGYSFQGWATSSTGGVSYAAGGNYTGNASITLYAVWKANTYTVSYNANGGSGAPGAQTKTYGVTLKLSGTKPTRTNYNFKGWGLSASSTTVSYAAGGNYTDNASVTLYAVWELAYVAPKINNFSVARCVSDGTISDSGTYVKVVFNWVTEKTVSSIKIEYKTETATTWTATTVTGTGTSGSVSKIIGGSISTEYTYNIRVTVSDSIGSSSAINNVSSMQYIIDVRSTGKGLAFGKPADTDNLMDVNYDLKLRKMLKGNVTTNDRFIRNTDSGGSWIGARNIATLTNKGTPGNTGSFYPILSCKTLNGSWNIGTLGESLAFSYDTDSNVSSGNNTSKVTWFYSDGTMNNPMGYITQSSIIKYSPLVGSWGFQLASNGWTGTHDKYFLGVNSNGEVHSGTQLNGASSITKRRVSMTDDSLNLLWSGAWYMSGSQDATLSSPISSQHKGILLIFSYYNGSAAVDSDFSCFFVPKNFDSINGAMGGVTFNCSDHWFNAMKYLHIYDTHLKGQEFNTGTRTVGGVTYENSKVVLRYIYGI